MRELRQSFNRQNPLSLSRWLRVLPAIPPGIPLRDTLTGLRASAGQIRLLKRYEDGPVRVVPAEAETYFDQLCLLILLSVSRD